MTTDGAFGEVWKGTHRGAACVVKTGKGVVGQAALQEEAGVLERVLPHSSIVPYFGCVVDEAGRILQVVLGWCPGGSVLDAVKKVCVRVCICVTMCDCNDVCVPYVVRAK